MNSLLVPVVSSSRTSGSGVFARDPIEPRIGDLPPSPRLLGGRGDVATLTPRASGTTTTSSSNNSGKGSDSTPPVLVMFGDHDWLCPPPDDLVRFMTAAKAAGKSIQFGVVPNAGHHLYLDNSPHFNEMVNRLFVEK